MKLAILTYYWQSSHGGGLNTYITGLVGVLNTTAPDIDINIIFVDGINDKKNMYKVSKGVVSEIAGSYSVLKKIKPDVVHVQESFEFLVSAAIYHLLYRNVRLIYTFQTEPQKPANIRKKIIKKLKRYPYQWALDQCDQVIFGTKDQERVCREVYGLIIRSKKIVIYPCIKSMDVTDEEKKAFCMRFNIPPGSMVLLLQAFTATRLKSDGAKLMIETLKKLKGRYPDVRLIVTREGAYSEELKEFARSEDCDGNVVFTGDLDNPFTPLALCDIFVWPWLGETGMGMALLEAMLAGKPIVATSAKGTLEPLIDEENSLIVRPTIGGLYDGVNRLYENKKLSGELGARARKLALEKYTWNRCAEKHLELYSGII